MARTYFVSVSLRILTTKYSYVHDSTTGVICSSKACFSSSTQPSQDGNKPILGAATKTANVDDMSGVTGFVADTATQGAAMVKDALEDVGDMAKETVNVAWDATKNASRNISDTAVAGADENVIDTVEYRSIQDGQINANEGFGKI